MKLLLAMLAVFFVLDFAVVAWLSSRGGDSEAAVFAEADLGDRAAPARARDEVPRLRIDARRRPVVVDETMAAELDGDAMFGGRVLELETNRPIADIRVELRTREWWRSRSRTDSDGRFEFFADERRELFLRVLEIPGFERCDPDVPVTDAMREGRQSVVLRARRVASSAVRGQLVYASTGQGVPFCALVLQGRDEQCEQCSTDGEGRFESRVRFNSGGMSMHVVGVAPIVGDEFDRLGFDHTTVDAEERIGADLWPTVFLDGALPPETTAGELEVQLRRTSRDPQPWSTSDDEHLTIAPDGRAFWRRARTSYNDARMSEWQLSIATSDQSWRAEVALSDLAGVVTVRPIWRKFGSIAVEVAAGNGVQPNWPVSVFIENREGDSVVIDRERELHTLAESPFRAGGLVAGEYTVDISAAFCAPRRERVVLADGEDRVLSIELAAGAPIAPIRCEVTTESGDVPRDDCMISLWRPGLQNIELLPISVRDRFGEPWKATYEISDVPEGDFKLTAYCGPFGFSPSYVIDVRAGDSVALRILDRPEYVDIGFRVFDADSGRELDTFDAWLLSDGTQQEFRNQPSGAIVAERAPANGRLAWRVTSDGYRCELGDLADPHRWSHEQGSKRWIDVHLRRGWNATCYAWNADDGRLSGVAILADDQPIGVTDSEGQLAIALERRPTSLTARYRDWHCTESTPADEFASMPSGDEPYFVFAP